MWAGILLLALLLLGAGVYYLTSKAAGLGFRVTSGIADWAIKLKTGCYSEYVIIDIDGGS